MRPDELSAAVETVVAAIGKVGARHALIGGLAIGLRARQRATKDADFVVGIPALRLPEVLEDLAAAGFSIDVQEAIRRWTADRFLAFARGPMRVDWIQPVLPVYDRVLRDAVPMRWSETCEVRVATAEGLVLTKMLAFRPQDQADIVALVEANGPALDRAAIRSEWSAFADTEPERTLWLEETLRRSMPIEG